MFVVFVTGANIVRVIAIDKDTDNNGRVSYVITSGNDDSRFSVGYDSGMITLVRPIVRDTVLQITANDHGSPPRRATMNLTLTLTVGQSSGPPRLLLPHPIVKVAEDLSIGGTVMNVGGPALNDQGESLARIYIIPVECVMCLFKHGYLTRNTAVYLSL